MLDRLGHQVGRATDRHQVDCAKFLDGIDGHLAALCFTDHAGEPGFLQHGVGELVHTGRGCRASRANHLLAHRVHRPHVIDEAALQINWQFLAFLDHVHHLLVGRIAAGQHLAGQQHGFTRLPLFHLFRGHRIQVHTANVLAHFPGNLRPVFQARRGLQGRAGAVQGKVGMPGGGTVRNDSDRLVGRVGRVVLHLHIQNGGQATEALGANTEIVDLVEQLQAQLFSAIGGTTLFQIVNIDRIEQGFLRHFHGFLGRAANTNTQHARRTPARAHLRHHFQHPVDDRV